MKRIEHLLLQLHAAAQKSLIYHYRIVDNIIHIQFLHSTKDETKTKTIQYLRSNYTFERVVRINNNTLHIVLKNRDAKTIEYLSTREIKLWTKTVDTH